MIASEAYDGTRIIGPEKLPENLGMADDRGLGAVASSIGPPAFALVATTHFTTRGDDRLGACCFLQKAKADPKRPFDATQNDRQLSNA